MIKLFDADKKQGIWRERIFHHKRQLLNQIRKRAMKLTGQNGKRRRHNRRAKTESLMLNQDTLEIGAPAWLNYEAAAEYNRVVVEARKLHLLNNLDLAVLTIYADSYDKYVSAASKIQSRGEMTLEINGRVYLSPYIEIAEKMATLILKCSKQLGLTVTKKFQLKFPVRAH